MKTIHPLSAELVTKIAAGEVVESPASVVKELIENAIDAESTQIDIELTESGIKKIIVRDNGKGMSHEDVLESFKPHTTSKLKELNDLFSISSFGFRGEALSSIASVSEMTIKSRAKGIDHGTQVELTQGNVVEENKVGTPEGTEIIINSLFHFTPARKKFLRDPRIELRHVAEVITHFALSNPSIGFTLINDSKEITRLPQTQTMEARNAGVLGEYLASYLIPVSHETRYGKVTGFIGKPKIAERIKYHQYLYVNGRTVSDINISKVVTDAFGSLIEPRTFPVFVLFLTIPYESVDVNVHPRKETVAFVHEKEIQSLIKDAVHKTLEAHDLAYNINTEPSFLRERGMDYNTADTLRSVVDPWLLASQDKNEVSIFHNLYLITQTPKGLLVVDQHAAHERILFEQFKKAFETLEHKAFLLPQAFSFDLESGETLLLEEQLETLQKIGFDIEPFGNNAFKLSAVPEVFKGRDYVLLIKELLKDTKNIDRQTERTLSFLACRTAIKGGEAISKKEAKDIIKKLLECTTPYTCPHGRPTHVEISLHELDKMFKRK